MNHQRHVKLIYSMSRTASSLLSERGIVSFPWERSQLPEQLASTAGFFKSHGYAILDNVLHDSDAMQVREEIKGLVPEMIANKTHLVERTSKNALLFDKDNIVEYDYMGKHPKQKCNRLVDALAQDRGFVDMINYIWGPILSSVLSSMSVKLQFNSGGCFPIHFDSDPYVDTRYLTCILYLNPGYQENIDGGELVLYPLQKDTRVVIPPSHNRMVVFHSQSMAHRVQPSKSNERVCLTIWCSAEQDNAQREALQRDKERVESLLHQLHTASDPSQRHILKQNLLDIPEIQRLVLKYVHREEWRTSIEESHQTGLSMKPYDIDNEKSAQILLSNFDQDIRTIYRSLGPLLSE